VLGLAALAVAVAFGAGILVGRMTVPGAAAVASPSAEPGASPSPDAIAGLPSEGSRLGRADAKVVIDYWADYQCPYCAKFAQDVIPQLVSRIADGTVALVHRDYAFLGPESVDAAIAVRCAERQGRFWPMHDAVYAAQVGENQGAFARSRLEVVAASVGLDATAFSACLDEREPLVEVLDDTAAGVRAGVSSTPTIDVNGTRFAGVSDVPGLLKAIDAAVAGASPAPLPTAQPPQDPWAALPTRGREAGNAAAPVTVELWMDYQATASATIANQLEPELRTRVGKGAIRVVQRDLATLGDESVLAAAAARCVASQGGPAWLTNDVLSVSARGQGQGIYTPVSLLRFASRLGLDVRAMSDCLDDPAVSADVRAETATGTAGGLTSAPAVVVLAGTKEVARFTGELDVTKILAAIDGVR
jgi:protein-disulfide isomerase